MKKYDGFKHIDELNNKQINSWRITKIKEVTLLNELIREFEPCITEKIVVLNLCKINSYNDGNDDIIVNVLVYDVEYIVEETNTQKYIYIPVDKLDKFIRSKKLVRILDDSNNR